MCRKWSGLWKSVWRWERENKACCLERVRDWFSGCWKGRATAIDECLFVDDFSLPRKMAVESLMSLAAGSSGILLVLALAPVLLPGGGLLDAGEECRLRLRLMSYCVPSSLDQGQRLQSTGQFHRNV